MKGQVSGIILILSLAMPVMLTFSYLQYQKKQLRKLVKYEIIKGIDRNELRKLSFMPTELKNLRWEHSKEFEYKGEMYDIVETRTSEDTTHYWCWWDNEETQLNRKLALLIKNATGQNKDQKESRQRLNQFLSSLYCVQSTYDVLLLPEHDRIAFKYQFSNISIITTPPNPPPELS